MEKAMATHSSTLAWKIPWTEEPGRLQSMGSLGVRHDWATSLSLFTLMHWRRKWQPTPVFLPGESQGQGSLVGWHLWGRTESDTTEATTAAAVVLKREILSFQHVTNIWDTLFSFLENKPSKYDMLYTHDILQSRYWIFIKYFLLLFSR